jgi:hypothetical protein
VPVGVQVGLEQVRNRSMPALPDQEAAPEHADAQWPLVDRV